MSAAFTTAPWMLVPPGGPQGPFWGLMNSKGNIVALQIVNESDARLMQVAPEMRELCELALDFHSIDTKAFVAKYGTGFTTKMLCDRLRVVLAKVDPLKQARPDRETEIEAAHRWQGETS